MSAAAPTSPFKFLDSYGAQDSAVFFGRDDEIETLYQLLTESRLVMVYGQSGTGKTSLIQCGLTHKFSPTNWLPVNVRRGDNINAALMTALKALAITPLASDATVPEAIRSVYLDHLRPLFLIFDQFEELYVLGESAEQEQFYATVRAVLDTELSCRIIVSLREEYLADLDPFERVVPTLFDKRLRVEMMTNLNVEKVILGTCAANGIVLEHGADTARRIIAQLDDKRIGVQLAYLQVYLDHLYRMVAGGAGPVIFTDAAIAEAGKLGDVMSGFLDEQEKAIQAQLTGKVPAGAIARLLEEFVSGKGTKQPRTYADVLKNITSAEPWLQSALELMQNSRLLRRVDDHYELAHDALAARIDERRSSDSKQLLMVKQLVENRLAEFPSTTTLLNGEEVALVAQASKLVDPLDASPLLKLNQGQLDYVNRSRRANRWRVLRWLGLILAIVLGAAGFGFYILLQNQDIQAKQQAILMQQKAAVESAAYTNNVADVLAFGNYQALRNSPDPNAASFARWTHAVTGQGNITREQGDKMKAEAYTQADADNSFWARLYAADDLTEKDPAAAMDAYGVLAKQQADEYAGRPKELDTIGKYKAVMWHRLFMQPAPDRNLANRLFDFLDLNRKIADDPLGFSDDIRDLCRQDAIRAEIAGKCAPYAPKDSNPASAEPGPAASTSPPPLKY
jgi:hypothetical protein